MKRAGQVAELHPDDSQVSSPRSHRKPHPFTSSSARVSTCACLGNLKEVQGQHFYTLERIDLKWTLIQRSPTVLCPTQTWDLLVLDGELVVVRDLLVDVNGLSGVDHNLLLRLHCDDLRITVRLKEKTPKKYVRHNHLNMFAFKLVFLLHVRGAEHFTKARRAGVVLHCSCG